MSDNTQHVVHRDRGTKKAGYSNASSDLSSSVHVLKDVIPNWSFLQNILIHKLIYR